MKFVSQITDMFFDTCRRPTPTPKLPPSNETIHGECTTLETIYSNQVIAAGTSKSSSRGSIYLGKISSSLECWFKHRTFLQVSLSLSNIPPQQLGKRLKIFLSLRINDSGLN